MENQSTAVIAEKSEVGAETGKKTKRRAKRGKELQEQIEQELYRVFSSFGELVSVDVATAPDDTTKWFAQVVFGPSSPQGACDAVNASGRLKCSQGQLAVNFSIDASLKLRMAKKVSFFLKKSSKTDWVATDVISTKSRRRGVSIRKKNFLENQDIILNYAEPVKRMQYHEMYNYLRKFHDRGQNILFIPVDDDSSLFKAVSHQLFGSPDNADFLRSQCVEHMMAHADYFSQFVDVDFSYYISKKVNGQDGLRAIGDHLDLQAVAELYDVNIEIYSPRSLTKMPSDSELLCCKDHHLYYCSEEEDSSDYPSTIDSGRELEFGCRGAACRLDPEISLSDDRRDSSISSDGSDYNSQESESSSSSDKSTASRSVMSSRRPSRSTTPTTTNDEPSSRGPNGSSLNTPASSTCSISIKPTSNAQARPSNSRVPTSPRSHGLVGHVAPRENDKPARVRTLLPIVFMYTTLTQLDTIRLSYTGNSHYDSIYDLHSDQDLGRNQQGRSEQIVLTARQKEWKAQKEKEKMNDQLRQAYGMNVVGTGRPSPQKNQKQLPFLARIGRRFFNMAKTKIRRVVPPIITEEVTMCRFVGYVELTPGQEAARFYKVLSEMGWRDNGKIRLTGEESNWSLHHGRSYQFLIGKPVKLIVHYPYHGAREYNDGYQDEGSDGACMCVEGRYDAVHEWVRTLSPDLSTSIHIHPCSNLHAYMHTKRKHVSTVLASLQY